MVQTKRSSCLLIPVVVVLSTLVLSTPLAASPVDVALTGAASESSNQYFPGLPASVAIDGITDGNFNLGHVTHTNYESQPWWQVHLTQVYDIDSIVIWNRTDAVPERLSNFRVSVFNGASEIWFDNYDQQGQYPNPSLSITLPTGTTGDRVRVMLNGTNYLSLAEVQVFSDVPEPVAMALAGLGLLGLLLARRRV